MPNSAGFDAGPALQRLQPFQRRTVDHVFRRFFLDSDQCRRFLVADEVGLGKTMVARGVIAKTLERLWPTVPRIDVVYICSNQAIAEQNVKKLNITAAANVARATRLTMLATQLGGKHGLDANRINFISLTPGTTLNLAYATGQAGERALLLRLLDGVVEPYNGVRKLLQVDVGLDNWRAWEAAIWEETVS
ncbi:MAG: DEAD/DEAH box helicase, partial [Alphaproteobacteria bacterium]